MADKTFDPSDPNYGRYVGKNTFVQPKPFDQLSTSEQIQKLRKAAKDSTKRLQILEERYWRLKDQFLQHQHVGGKVMKEIQPHDLQDMPTTQGVESEGDWL